MAGQAGGLKEAVGQVWHGCVFGCVPAVPSMAGQAGDLKEAVAQTWHGCVFNRVPAVLSMAGQAGDLKEAVVCNHVVVYMKPCLLRLGG